MLCEHWSAHKAYRLGLIMPTSAPALKVDGKFVANPLVGDRRAISTSTAGSCTANPRPARRWPRARALWHVARVDLSLLDEKVEELCAKLLLTFPECPPRRFEELRKPKLEAWNRNKENSRAWLALNMMAEARTGFRAFNEGPKDHREIDFLALRQALARRPALDRGFIESLMPKRGESGR